MIGTSHRCVVARVLQGVALSMLSASVAASAPSREPTRQARAASSSATPLKSGAVVERAIGPGDEQVFQVSIAQDEVLRVAVDQLGADVSLVLQFGSDAPVTVDDEDKRRYGRELSVWQAPARGVVTVTVRGAMAAAAPAAATQTPTEIATPASSAAPALDFAPTASRDASPAGHNPHQPPPPRYRLTLTILSPTDVLTRATTATSEARRLSREARTPGQGKNAEVALQTLHDAVDGWRAYGDRELLALSLTEIGRFQMRPLQRPVDCVTSLKEALVLYETLTLPTEIASTLEQIGNAQLWMGARDEGRATFERAYSYADVIDPLNRATLEDDLANASTYLGDFDRGVMYSQRAIATFRAAGARRDEFLALEHLAQIYQRMRRFDEALRTATDAIALAREHGRDDDLAGMTRTLGVIHLASGDDEAALATFRTALDLFKGQPPSRLATMLSIGRLYNQDGDPAQAREWLEKTLAAVPPQLRDYWAATASELGWSLTALGEPARALELQRKAVDLVTGQSMIGELSMLPSLAETCRALGDFECARKATARASEVADTFPGRPYEAIILRERARDARAAGDLPQARQHLDAALAVMESERGRLRTQVLRTSFGAMSGAYYDDAIDLAMAMHAAAPRDGHDARAFELFERSRARSLSDLLAEARNDIKTGVDPALLAEQRALETRLGAKDTELRDLAGKSIATERAPALDREIDDLTRQLAVLDARIRETSPRYAALTQPAPLSLIDTQRLLDDRTVLLAFSGGPARMQAGRAPAGWGWAITRDAVRSFPLPAGRAIEAAARKVYDGLAARQRYVAADGPERLARIDRDLDVDAAALSDAVLGPIAAALQGEWRAHRLAIVATGPLEYIPFAALPVPSTAAASRAWLVSTHELVQLPSASVLARLREDESRRAPASRTLAVIADAVYGADDPRVHATPESTTATPPMTTATAVTTPATTIGSTQPPPGTKPTAPAAASDQQQLLVGLDRSDHLRSGFRRLVFSREEANAIVKLAASGQALEALDFKANLATITSPALADARIIHIASHGILNSARPELSGLVLSLVDENGRPQEGVLRLYDVFNLKLSADLVVLSACQTGLGRQMRGEGLVGLSRAFMYAGAPRIVASLWQVDDLATADLMRRFYQGMLVRKLSAAAALRAAQEEMRTSGRFRAPYYWAAFTLMGDWR